MTEEEEDKAEPGGIWTPPEPLEVNVQRMAWTLFLECWKAYVNGQYHARSMRDVWIPEQVYDMCLKTAKVVRLCEGKAGGS